MQKFIDKNAINDSGVLYDIERISTTLMLIGGFDEADGLMDWQDISKVVSFLGRELNEKILFVQNELKR